MRFGESRRRRVDMHECSVKMAVWSMLPRVPHFLDGVRGVIPKATYTENKGTML